MRKLLDERYYKYLKNHVEGASYDGLGTVILTRENCDVRTLKSTSVAIDIYLTPKVNIMGNNARFFDLVKSVVEESDCEKVRNLTIVINMNDTFQRLMIDLTNEVGDYITDYVEFTGSFYIDRCRYNAKFDNKVYTLRETSDNPSIEDCYYTDNTLKVGEINGGVLAQFNGVIQNNNVIYVGV